jgi:hypothetical protein
VRARLGRYGLWQLRDYAIERGLPTLVVSGIVLLPLFLAARAWRGAPHELDAFARAGLTEASKVLAFVIVLLGVNGLVSNDRKSGAFRLLFAKPVPVPRYYAQAFVVHLGGALAATLLLMGAYAAIVRPVWAPGLLLFVALYWVLLGGVLFLASTLMRHDWIVAAGLWVVAQLVREVMPPGTSLVGAALEFVLPPAHLMSPIADALVGGGRLPPALALAPGDEMRTVPALLWILAWGVGAFAAGLLVLRRRPLA